MTGFLGSCLRVYGATPVVLRVALALAWAAAIWFLSSGEVTIGTQLPLRALIGNAAHVVIFGILAGLCWFALPGAFAGHDRGAGVRRFFVAEPDARRRCWVGVVCAVVWGITDEIHQSTVPGRFASYADVATDFLGACLAVTVLAWLATGRRTDRRRIPWLVVATSLSVAAATWLHW